MIGSEIELKKIIKVLNDTNILKDLILIGSWSMIFYKKIFDNFKPTLETIDLDFYIPNSKKVSEDKSTINAFKLLNYEILTDRLTNKSKLISAGGFEIEFLTNLNRDNIPTVKIGNTNLYAESLSYVNIFNGNYIEVDFEGYKVKVASPSSYILQKLLINDKRGEKGLKDIESIRNLLIYINESKKSREELKTLYYSLPKKWKVKIKDKINEFNLSIKL